MTINPDNDKLEVFRDGAGEWRWRRCDTANGKIVATSGEGYNLSIYAREAALAYNGDLPIEVESEHPVE